MSLTIEMLKQDATIAGASLSDSVLNAIATLSTNDENVVIKAKQGEAYGLVDTALNAALGETKPQGQQTSVWFAQKIKDLKAQAAAGGNVTELTEERDSLKIEMADLKKKIADGNTDAALKKQLEDLQADLKQKQKDLDTLKTTNETKIKELETGLANELKTNLNLKLQSEADAYFSTLTFDQKLPDWAIEAKKKEVIGEVLKMGVPAWDGEGEKRAFVFKDTGGAVLNNGANQLKPFTFGELAADHVKDAIVGNGGTGGTGGGGTGGGAGSGAGAGGGSFSIAGMKSKQEVVEAIKTKLAADGVTVIDPDYQGKFDEMYATEGVKDLPHTA